MLGASKSLQITKYFRLLRPKNFLQTQKWLMNVTMLPKLPKLRFPPQIIFITSDEPMFVSYNNFASKFLKASFGMCLIAIFGLTCTSLLDIIEARFPEYVSGPTRETGPPLSPLSPLSPSSQSSPANIIYMHKGSAIYIYPCPELDADNTIVKETSVGTKPTNGPIRTIVF